MNPPAGDRQPIVRDATLRQPRIRLREAAAQSAETIVLAWAETWQAQKCGCRRLLRERHSTPVQGGSANREAKETSARRCAPPPSEHPRKRQNATTTWAAGFPRKRRRPQQPKRSTKALEAGHEHDEHPGVVRIEGGRRFPSATRSGLNTGRETCRTDTMGPEARLCHRALGLGTRHQLI